VFENREVKAEVTKLAEAELADTAIFGSNTSTLPITGLAEEFGAAEESSSASTSSRRSTR
jgi:3-hydroxyacyl-CoA dehydrogenase